MKKFLSIILPLAMLFSLSVTAFAAEETVVEQTTYTNEYDYITTLQQMDSESLSEIGMTSDDEIGRAHV